MTVQFHSLSIESLPLLSSNASRSTKPAAASCDFVNELPLLDTRSYFKKPGPQHGRVARTLRRSIARTPPAPGWHHGSIGPALGDSIRPWSRSQDLWGKAQALWRSI